MSDTLRIIGMIPARLASTRLPNKVLLDIGGKPMIQHVYERACQARYIQEVIVAFFAMASGGASSRTFNRRTSAPAS